MKPLPPFQPIDFGLKQLEVTNDLLRLYCVQGLAAPFGFAESWLERLELLAQEHPDGPFEDPLKVLPLLDRDGLDRLLDDQLPDQFLVRESCWESHCNGEDAENFRFEGPEKDGPELFTRVWQVSFDSGGLVVMELFATQILVLLNGKGEVISEHCHDLHLGMGGSTLLRTSSDPCWELTLTGVEPTEDLEARVISRDATGVTTLEVFGPFDDVWERFPDLENRDVGLFQGFLTEEAFLIYEEVSSVISEALLALERCEMDEVQFEGQVSQLLVDTWGSYRYLQPYYSNHPDLALKAVVQDPRAFTLLDDQLRNDLEWVLTAIDGVLDQTMDDESLANQVHALFRFLPAHIRKDKAVLARVLPLCPGLIAAVAPIHEPAWMRLAVGVLNRGRNAIHYASDELLSNRDFMLEMAELDWQVLAAAKANLLTEEGFVDEAIRRYNDSAQHAQASVNLQELCEYMFNFSSLRHLMIDRLEPANSIDQACHWIFRLDLEHIPAVRRKIPVEIWNSESLWIRIAERAEPEKLIENIPLTFASDPMFAEKIVQIRGELILACSDELRASEELVMLALQHLRSWRHGTDGLRQKVQELIVQLKDTPNRDLLLLAGKQFGPGLIQSLRPDLFDDIEFMRSAVQTISAYWYEQASPRLKVHPPFVELTLEQNVRLFQDMPEAIQNDPYFASWKERLDSTGFNDLPF